LRPQETGNKTEVRRASLTNADGFGLRIAGAPVFELNAYPYGPLELERYTHQHLLPDPNKTVVRVNYRQMGVGGDDSWGALVHPEYTLLANRTNSYSFVIGAQIS
jgi:beta-galactosidase